MEEKCHHPSSNSIIQFDLIASDTSLPIKKEEVVKEELTMYALPLHLCLLEEDGLFPSPPFFNIKL